MKTNSSKDGGPKKRGRTPEEQDNIMIGLSVDLAEKQLREGTASPLVISHYLKLGSSRAKLETEKMQLENELLKAKTESLKSQKATEELYQKAINAMKRYNGDMDVGDNNENI